MERELGRLIHERDAFDLANDIVRLVYFDESGIGDGATEPIVVVAAVIVRGDDQLRGINREVRNIYELLPADKRDRFEFKASTMFAHYRKFGDESKYRPIMIQFLELMRRYELPIQWCAIDRAGFSRRETGTLRPQDLGFFASALFVETWFIEHASTEGGLCISDRGRSEQTMHDMVRELRLTGIPQIKSIPFEHLVDTIMFSDSKRSVGLQMADFANFFKRMHLMKDALAEPLYRIIAPFYDECLGQETVLFSAIAASVLKA